MAESSISHTEMQNVDTIVEEVVVEKVIAKTIGTLKQITHLRS